jgi:hypothetical protein
MTERIPRKIADLHETDPGTDAIADKLLADSELMNSSLPDFRLEQPSRSDSDVDPQSKVIKDILDSDFNAHRFKGVEVQSLTKIDIPVDDLQLVGYVSPNEKINTEAISRQVYTGRLDESRSTTSFPSTISERPLGKHDELLYPEPPKTPLERELARKALRAKEAAAKTPPKRQGFVSWFRNLLK